MCRVALLSFFLLHVLAFSATIHVWTNSPDPGPPFNAWSNAAHTIQTALDEAVDTDMVWVTNGTYLLTGQVSVTNEVTIQSVNGSEATLIDGNGLVTSNRCVYITASNVTFEGFTVMNGMPFDSNGGGIRIDGPGAVVRSCIIVSNWTDYTGGGFYLYADDILLEDCLIADNSADWAGGVSLKYNTVIRNCEIRNNRARGYSAGGVQFTTYGAETATLHNCFISGNTAPRAGGVEQYQGTLELYHCTISGNRAELDGGGLMVEADSQSNTVVRNTVIYFNKALVDPEYRATFDDDSLLTAGNSCLSPLPGGAANTDNPPGLASPFSPNLVSNAVCVDAANNATCFSALDVDDEPRTNGVSVDVGCDEFWAPGMTGAITAVATAFPSNAVLAQPIEFTSLTDGRVSGFEWDFGDGQADSNACVIDHAYGATGVFNVVLTAWNLDGQTAATLTVHVAEGFTNYVAESGGSHTPPFTSWATAASNIQAAVDANTYAGGVTLVATGVYNRGGAVFGPTNRVAITKPLSVRAADPDSALTIIKGVKSGPSNSVRCAYLTEGARLVGFTLTNGAALQAGGVVDKNGGGVFLAGGGVVSNCVITGNTSRNHGGGGACYGGGEIVDCTISGNQSTNYGGGFFAEEGGLLSSCDVIGNFGVYGGGARLDSGAIVSNCLFQSNTSKYSGGAIYCYGSSAIYNSTSRYNTAGGDGGGFFVYQGGTVRGCTVIGNTATNDSRRGGGIYVRNGGSISDSTIRRNASTDGGGMAFLYGGGTATHCVVEQNWAGRYGGGAYCDKSGVITHSEIKGNACNSYGGGLNFNYGGVVRDSLIEGNFGGSRGGGVQVYYTGEVVRCVIRDNRTFTTGGGVYTYRGGNVTNSLIAGNRSRWSGGGVYFYKGGVMESCTVVDNLAEDGMEGGGVYGSSGGTLVNTIVYSNIAPTGPNFAGSGLTWSNCCTTPATGAAVTVTNPPQFLYYPGADYRLSSGSPCINAGTNQPWMAGATDLLGSPRISEGIVDIGTYEVGPLTCGFTADPERGIVPLTVDFTGYVTGSNTSGVTWRWDFENNGLFDVEGLGTNTPQHIYTNEGLHSIRLSVSNAAGESAVCVRSNYVMGLTSNIHYVDPAGSHTYPFTSWPDAANDIQAAVDAAAEGSRVVVTDGTYEVVVNVFVTKTVDVHSVNGPDVTVLDGRGTQRGFWLEKGASVSGFTVTNGNGYAMGLGGGGIFFVSGGTASNCILTGCAYSGFETLYDGLLTHSMVCGNTRSDGGGGWIRESGTVARCSIFDNTSSGHGGGIYIWGNGVIRDSVLSNNYASSYGGGVFMNNEGLVQRCVVVTNRAGYGGGIHSTYGSVEDCLVIENHANSDWGGVSCAYGSTPVRNCTIVLNSAPDAGGTYQGAIVNSIVYGNTGSNYAGGVFSYSCTTPHPGGVSNIISTPAFVGGGDYHLDGSSLCIETGTNLPGGWKDCDGVSRPLDGDNDGTSLFDMGCYEYIHPDADSDGDTMLDFWEANRHLDPTNAADANVDSDGDGPPNKDEYTADTDPLDADSYFHLGFISNLPPLRVVFMSSSNRQYILKGNSNLVAGDWTNVPGQGPRPGTGGLDWMQVTNSDTMGFYRLNVSLP